MPYKVTLLTRFVKIYEEESKKMKKIIKSLFYIQIFSLILK